MLCCSSFTRPWRIATTSLFRFRWADRADGHRLLDVEVEPDIGEAAEIISPAAALHSAAAKSAAAMQQFQIARLFGTEN
jgi:hypothetical protein